MSNTSSVCANIMKRLPLKTVGQCLCVCKSLNALLTSTAFVDAHTQGYSQLKTNLLLLHRQFINAPKQYEEYIVFLDSTQKQSNLEPQNTFTCPCITRNHKYFRVVGTVNGLICLSDDFFGYTNLAILWNPLLHRYIRLPMPNVNHAVTGSHRSCFGFGYDTKRATHKVVKVSYLHDQDKGLDVSPPLVELYSVKGGRWRKVYADYVRDIFVGDYKCSPCFLNGGIHWVGQRRTATSHAFLRNLFLVFNVEEEQFKRIKFPQVLAKECIEDLRIIEYDSKLSILHNVMKQDGPGSDPANEMMECCDIWVMEEYTKGGSWCKMVSVEMNSTIGLDWVQCLRRNGDVLGFTRKEKLVSYDPLTKQIKSLGAQGCWDSSFTCSYTESLVLLDKKEGVGQGQSNTVESPSNTRLVNTRPRGLWFLRDESWVPYYRRGGRSCLRIRRKLLKYHMVFSWQKKFCGYNILQNSHLQKGNTCARHAVVAAIEYRKRISVTKSCRYQYLFERSSYRKPRGKEVNVVVKNIQSSESDEEYVWRVKLPMHIKRRVFVGFTRNQRRKELSVLSFPRLAVDQVIDHAMNLYEEVDRQGPLNEPYILEYILHKGVTLDKNYKRPGWRTKRRVFPRTYDILFCERDPQTKKPFKREDMKNFEDEIIKNYMQGPVVGRVLCNDETDFYSKKGFDVYDGTIQEEGHIYAHSFVIIGHGNCTRMGMCIKGLRRRKSCFFLTQDSNGMRCGPFKNGLCVVFTKALDRVYVPCF